MSKDSSSHPSLLSQFRSFCYQNKITDIEKAVEYFSVFGGMGWWVDVSIPLDELIETKILKNYRYIHGDITKITHSKSTHHAMLTALAKGDRREHSAFKKINIGRDNGEEVIDFLIKDGFLVFDKSIEKPVNEKDGISDKLLFVTPFMRFWFAMVSPNYKSISSGDFSEFSQKWQQLKGNFSILLSNLLVRELVTQSFAQKFADDTIVSIGSYYDKHTHIELLAKRKSGKLLAGACKYSQKPAKPNMLETLKQKCKKAELDVSDYVLFSKNGFDPEVEEMKDGNVTLLSATHLSSLLDDLSKDDLLAYKNRKY